jgi:hypothetical protein
MMSLPISASLLTVLVAIFLTVVIRPLYSLIANRKSARASNLPYIIVPFFFWNKLWRAFQVPVLALSQLILPKSWSNSFHLQLTHPDFTYNLGWQLHEQLGESFIIVTPETNFFCTAEPEVISRICAEREIFPKPIDMYEMTDIYGKNVLTMEGGEWRRHRRVVGILGEKSVRGVWKESLWQAQEMVEYWNRVDESDEKGPKKTVGTLVNEMARDTMRLSLYVISRAGFNVRCVWPGRERESNSEGLMSATEIKGNHKMSYVASLETLLHSLVAVITLPIWLLGKSLQYLMIAH